MGNGVSVNPSAIGVAVGFGFLFLLFAIGIIHICCKGRCRNCKNPFKKKKSMKDKVLNKVGIHKDPPPFSISGTLKR